MRGSRAIRRTAILLLVCISEATALELQGVHLGDSWEPQHLEQELSMDGIAEKVHCSRTGSQPGYCSGNVRYEGKLAKITLVAKHEKITQVFLDLSLNDLQEILPTLIARFGAPTSDSGAGKSLPSYALRTITWKAPADSPTEQLTVRIGMNAGSMVLAAPLP